MSPGGEQVQGENHLGIKKSGADPWPPEIRAPFEPGAGCRGKLGASGSPIGSWIRGNRCLFPSSRLPVILRQALPGIIDEEQVQVP